MDTAQAEPESDEITKKAYERDSLVSPQALKWGSRTAPCSL